MFQYRAIQYDASRGRIPKPETVRDRLDFLKPYGVNMLCFYIESVVQSDALPAVGCGVTPITKPYLAELRGMCEQRGILFTPIVQILGHQEKVLALDAFERLGEVPPPQNRGAAANNFLPGSEEARRTLFAWIEEMLPFVNSPFVHVGCDEAWTLGKGRSRELVDARGLGSVFAEYVASFNDFLKSRGKTLVFWADFIVDHPDALALLPPDVVVANWGYGTWQESFERDNHHFAAHPQLASRGHRVWVCGNNMAEYIFTPFQRLEANTTIWMDLARRHGGAEAFLITDWGSYENVNPFALSLIGDVYVLMKLRDPGVTLNDFVRELSRRIVGAEHPAFIEGMSLLLQAQGNPSYFPQRDIDYFPCFPGLLFGDPGGWGSTARRFGCYERDGLDSFLSDAHRAHGNLQQIGAIGSEQPKLLEDLVMLSSRVLMLALRARLWHDVVWDTGNRFGDTYAAECRRRARWRREYIDRAERDLAWYGQRWHDDCLETEWPRCRDMMRRAIQSIGQRINDDGSFSR